MAGAPIPITECGEDGCNETLGTTGLCLADGTPIAVVTTRNCETGVVTEDGWIDLTTGIFTPGIPPGGTTSCASDNYEFALSGWLCDVLPDGSVAGIALVQIERDASGAVIGITLIGIDGLPYVPVGTMMKCPDDQVSAFVLCDAGNGDLPFIRFFFYDASGIIPSRDTDLDGTPYIPIGPAVQCVTGVTIENWRDDAEYLVLCDDGAPGVEFLRRYDVSSVGGVTVTDTELDGTTPYVVIGTAIVCPNVVTVAGSVTVVPLASANVSTYRNDLVGAGVWALGVDTHGGKVKSISFRRRAGGGLGTVTITDAFGTVTTLQAGESETWSVGPLDDEIVGPLLVTTTVAANDVIILWTEAP